MSFNFTNKQVAKLLRSVSAAYQVKNENKFRIIAYQRAADSVEHATSEVKDLWDDSKLDELAGIGKAITAHLDQLFRKGRVGHFNKIMSGLPPAMFKLLSIPGVGPKTAYKLCQRLKLKDVKSALKNLEKAAKEGKIRVIEGFGEASEEEILKGIQAFRRGQIKEKRMLLPYADLLAEEVISYLEKCSAVVQADPLGSLRRKVSTIGDVDIAVATEKPKELLDHFVKYPKIKRVLSRGEEALCRVILKSGRQVDLRLQKPASYGSMLQYFTGSKHHNIALRELALKKGFSLSEHGIRIVKETKKLIEFEKEEDFYRFLGLGWIPPELRENAGEIEAAQKSSLPRLLESREIKGDLHTHSNFLVGTSHDEGQHPFKEMLESAAYLGHQYLGFAEHNPSTSKHSEKEIIDILKRKKEKIDQLKYSCEKQRTKSKSNLPVYPLNGLEIDIKPSGKLSVPEKGLELLDYAIASIHSSFRMSREKMTQRVLAALFHPKVKILGHPTGRMLGKREGYELDWNKIFDFCLKNNKFLEICAYPNRLDLPDVLVREAVKNSVKMIINTDSHCREHLHLMEYGVSVARRGWATKKDIVNTLPLKEFLDRMGVGK